MVRESARIENGELRALSKIHDEVRTPAKTLMAQIKEEKNQNRVKVNEAKKLENPK